jgi:hypothetical protein
MSTRCDHCGRVIDDDEPADIRFASGGPAYGPSRRYYHVECARRLEEDARRRGVISNGTAFLIIAGAIAVLTVAWGIFTRAIQ